MTLPISGQASENDTMKVAMLGELHSTQQEDKTDRCASIRPEEHERRRSIAHGRASHDGRERER